MRTYRHWTRTFSLEEFARREGLPEGDVKDLVMVYVNPVFGVTGAFLRELDESTNQAWSRTWGKRTFLRNLGLEERPADLAVVHVSFDRVTLKFIS